MQQFLKYLEKNPKKVLIFDFDETLFTLELPWHIFFNGLVERLQELDPGLHEERSIVALEHRAVRQFGNKANKIINHWSNEFERQYLQGVSEHISLTNFIRKRSAEYDIFLWTSNTRGTVEPILKEVHILSYFQRTVTADDVRMIKPDPEGFDLIRTDNRPLDEFLMIGDSSNDQEAAAAAGIDFFKVDHDEQDT
ncbi:MAG: HAD-IA family hydrolase [Patescibacteria group bacterium]